MQMTVSLRLLTVRYKSCCYFQSFTSVTGNGHCLSARQMSQGTKRCPTGYVCQPYLCYMSTNFLKNYKPHILFNDSVKNFSTVSWVTSIATSSPVLLAQDTLQYLQNVTDWPWWAVIMVMTFGLRSLITFPLAIYQNIVLAKYANLQPEINELVKNLKAETAVAVKRFEWSTARARFAYNRSLKKHIQRLVERDNCHPFKGSIVLWIQIPAWISISFALRNMVSMLPYNDLGAQLLFLELTSGGFLWIPNLTIPDASFVLPITLGLLNWVIVEIHSLKTLKTSRFQKIITNLLRGMSLVMVPIAASVPSCLAVYWTASSLTGLIQNLVLMSPTIRRTLKVPLVVGETSTPYKDLVVNLKKKFGKTKVA